METKLTKSQIRRIRAKEKGVCVTCAKVPPVEGKTRCEKCAKYFVDFNRKNAHIYEPRKKLYRQRLRVEIIEKYGNKCACCGEENIEFLSIDHTNGDGNVERRALYGKNNPSSYSWYLKLKREPKRDDLRVLCYNCNLAIGFCGYCPHNRPSTEIAT